MESNLNPRAVRVNGEVIVLHCWACGTAHCVELELCVPAELSHMVCSNRNCRMSMFLVNELAGHDHATKQLSKRPLNPRANQSRFW